MKTKTGIIQWKATKEESAIITKIAKRAEPLYKRCGLPDSRMTIHMDIENCHGNACQLDLAGLLHADDLDFNHDILGIRRHIDRQNGGWEDGTIFEPRYALANHAQ